MTPEIDYSVYFSYDTRCLYDMKGTELIDVHFIAIIKCHMTQKILLHSLELTQVVICHKESKR